RIRTPASRTKTWRATPATPLPSAPPTAYPPPPLPLLVHVRVVLRRVDLVALAVLDVGAVVLRDVLGVGDGRRAADVLGAVDELRLSELEALGLPAAGLLDRAHGRVVALAGR